MPFPSTRICPSLDVATAIEVPVATGLGDGLGDGFGEGLEAAVDGDEPPQAASSADAMAPVIMSFNRMHPDTDPGYDDAVYSGVTYAAVRPPSTRNVVPFT